MQSTWRTSQCPVGHATGHGAEKLQTAAPNAWIRLDARSIAGPAHRAHPHNIPRQHSTGSCTWRGALCSVRAGLRRDEPHLRKLLRKEQATCANDDRRDGSCAGWIVEIDMIARRD